jgi:large subunit ribosomal protein L10
MVEKETQQEEKEKISRVPEYKKKLVADLIDKIKKSRTILIVSIKNLPDAQFQLLKKKLRGKAEVVMSKKSLLLRAIENSEKGALQNLKEKITADIAILFSDIDAFELSGFLTDNQNPAKARPGDVAPEDINIEPGPTELMPGPAISELSGVGLKVAVENGKLAIKQGRVVAKKGEEINGKLASVLAKLNVEPMKVGLEPVAAFDSESDKVYLDIKIDKEGTLKELREAIAKSLNFAVNVKFVNEKTISYFIGKAGLEEKAIEGLIEKGSEKPAEETKTEETTEEKSEEVKEEKPAESENKEEKKDAE